jgi:hypothetical protein
MLRTAMTACSSYPGPEHLDCFRAHSYLTPPRLFGVVNATERRHRDASDPETRPQRSRSSVDIRLPGSLPELDDPLWSRDP